MPDVLDAGFAKNLGLEAIYVDDQTDLQPAWATAMAADRPVVIEVITDPEIVSFPPHISLAQVKAFMSLLAKEDPQRGISDCRYGVAAD